MECRSDFYVYLWRNLVNGKCYVGKGRGNRFKAHLLPGCRSPLALAIKKHGRDSFECRILCTDMEEALALDIEKKTVLFLGCKAPNGYNATDGGGGLAGYKTSPETLTKRSLAMRGKNRRPCPPEQRKLLSDLNRGKKLTEEHKQKIRNASTVRGVPLSEEHRNKISAALTGREMSDAWRDRMSKARQGKKHTEETKRKMAAAGRNRKASPETKEKMRAAWVLRRALKGAPREDKTTLPE
jgi:group I intron endonuclease